MHQALFDLIRRADGRLNPKTLNQSYFAKKGQSAVWEWVFNQTVAFPTTTSFPDRVFFIDQSPSPSFAFSVVSHVWSFGINLLIDIVITARPNVLSISPRRAL
jgi:hypothetical protein